MANILLVGYGRMGQAIEKIAIERGNTIVGIIDQDSQDLWNSLADLNADVAIEFTQPGSAFGNISKLLEAKIPTVVGTTGWLEQKPEIEKLAQTHKTGFFYASNFSVGVNIFFNLNKVLAKLMNNFPDYNIDMEEIHHIHKLDEPSGTAITLAEGIFENNNNKKDWKLNEQKSQDDLAIVSTREGEVPGTHIINYRSEIDNIEIKHTAHNRKGFATGAVLAAEWMVGKEGTFGMNDMLNI